jgi:hypothetical protein
MNIRPEVKDTITSDPPTDERGMKMPRRLGALTMLRSIPGLPSQFRSIPDDFFTLDVNEEGYTEAVIACPCGETPTVEIGRLVECACERFFLNMGVRVLVANSPVPPAAEPDASPEAVERAASLSD